jgi:uncharacterized protein (TIGR02145 family)
MKRLAQIVTIIGLFSAIVIAQNISTPVFVLKDGDASASAYTGTDKSIYVDGGLQQNVGWITFRLDSIDLSKISSAKLELHINSVKTPGSLQIKLLADDITAPENNVRLADIPVQSSVTATQSLSTADVEKIVRIDLTITLKQGGFRGVALISEDGLAASFDSREGHMAPMIMITNRVDSVAVKWLSGTEAPQASLGKDGDYYLNTATGDLYARAVGIWSLKLNIVGPRGLQGLKGDTGPAGAIGSKGDKGDIGPQGPVGATGPKGDQGLAGATGAIGPKGDNGGTGPQGPAGVDGKSIKWRGTWSTDSTYAIDEAVYLNGNSYIAITSSKSKNPADSAAYWNLMAVKGDLGARILNGSGTPSSSLGRDGDYYLNAANGDVLVKLSGAWVVAMNLMGPAGAQGPKGDKGDKGDQGIQGAQGIQGLPGTAGANGQSPVTTLSELLKVTSKGGISITFLDNHQAFGIGQRIRIASTTAPDNFMEGVITKYISAKGLATVSLDNCSGSGTEYSSWTVTVAGSFPSGTAVGDMQYWNGSKWVRIAAGQPGQVMTLSGSQIPQWSQIPGTVTDIDGNVYHTIVIGNQEWTMQNIRTTHYNDGTAIPNVTDNAAWSGLTTGAFCYYNNTTDAEAQQKYGALYNWYAVNTGNLAPSGWRVPDTTDWNNLENYLIANGYNYDGTTSGNKIAKSLAAGSWKSNTNAGAVGNNLNLNNKSGFSALGGGIRLYDGSFSDKSNSCYWWSAPAYGSSIAFCRYFSSYINGLSWSYSDKLCGSSVRLVRDLN